MTMQQIETDQFSTQARAQRRKPRTFFIRTYGCQMNENDTEVMVGMLKRRGLARTEEEGEADLLIYNTCSIRDLAERKVMGKIGRISFKRSDQIIGVTGCMANAKKESLLRKLPVVDFVLGTSNIHELDSVLDEVLETGRTLVRTDDEFKEELNYLGAEREDKVKAFVSIIRGCDKYCTYCVVPYTRGPEVSRNPDSIVEECRKLVENGYREITLLGQNVNSYGKDQPEWGCRFHDLLTRIDAIPGLAHLRFMTSHPVDITRELMEAVRDLPTLSEFVHFPLQAGSNRVLKKMHRIYTVEQYLEKVALFREIVPNVSLGTDIIVGFPTETDEEFEETYRLMEQIRFSVSFIFAYSPRNGTPAMRWKDDVPESVKQQRLHRLLDLHQRIATEQREQLLGTTMPVLFERRSTRNPQLMKGRTRCWKNVLVATPNDLSGELAQVRMTSFTHQTFVGELESIIPSPFYERG
jgi:tRNA-2-methylthio-N6-dimethylallyladenosine synthase